ncbi:aldehyde dehydrogenase family protein [Streptomyces sp. A3M-1-3]|uniref:aldehyde dehydrogenase family protein n=1 Tax=Streptomyces sp. A3M-1-3 TaxID=2962044 RepID=UPI0020B7ABD9|nr:aldehyde dehydrogenase family protein [Streptomyces sp. A3M-1-3]MCP3822429.1 aldehyde dehydrogenase family protein [Streptomyces sp. A3M-1-3]
MADLYIDGKWREAVAGGHREVRCPADGTVVRAVSEGTRDDTEAAIDAARRAFDEGPWPRTPERERGALLLRTAHIIERDAKEFARAESLDTGKRLVESEYDIADIVACFRYYGGIAGTSAGRVIDTGRDDAISRVVYEPAGVCGLITPWNYPLLQASWKVAPALLVGNTVILKPSELTPSTSVLLMRALEEAGLPAGAANLVLGAGPEVGAPLAEHPGVDMVSFTGGFGTGRRLMATAAATVKKVALELGGKNPNVVFADADVEAAVDFALTAVFLHSGQVCSAGTRLIVEDSLHDTFVDEVVRRAGLIRLGGPFDPEAETGPLISAQHRAKVEEYVAAGLAEGAVLRCGGRRPDDQALADGFYFLPTVLDECRQDMRVVHEESFGPVLTVERFSDEHDAVRIANDTDYGLAGAVWTEDAGKAQRVARRLRHGTVWINDYHPYVPQAEWGGFGHSGTGRELGPTGLEEYREPKHIWQNIQPRPQHWFRG